MHWENWITFREGVLEIFKYFGNEVLKHEETWWPMGKQFTIYS